jgi:hypothetical protein
MLPVSAIHFDEYNLFWIFALEGTTRYGGT